MKKIPDAALEAVWNGQRPFGSHFVPQTSRAPSSDEGVPVILPSVAARRARRFIPALPEALLLALARLPGKALVVYLIVWQRSHLTRSATVTCSSSLGALYGLTWRQMTLALTALAQHGFIAILRRRGKSPLVTLQEGVFEPRHPESSP